MEITVLNLISFEFRARIDVPGLVWLSSQPILALMSRIGLVGVSVSSTPARCRVVEKLEEERKVKSHDATSWISNVAPTLSRSLSPPESTSFYSMK